MTAHDTAITRARALEDVLYAMVARRERAVEPICCV